MNAALKTSDLKRDGQKRLEVVEAQPFEETRVAYASTGDLEYVGKAAPGTPTSTALWRIDELTVSNGRVERVQTKAWVCRDEREMLVL